MILPHFVLFFLFLMVEWKDRQITRMMEILLTNALGVAYNEFGY